MKKSLVLLEQEEEVDVGDEMIMTLREAGDGDHLSWKTTGGDGYDDYGGDGCDDRYC